MSYNSFTNKNKLQVSDLESKKQENSISLQQIVEQQIINRTIYSQPRNTVLSNNIQWDSDWELMDNILTGAQYRQIWKNWIIPIGRINQNLIPNFYVDIIVKNGVNGEGDSSLFQVSANIYFLKFIGWDIKDIEEFPGSDMKDISLVASIYSNLNTQPLFYSKLLVKYINNSISD